MDDKRNKIKLASELWKTMPDKKGSEFRKEFKKKHGVSISQPAAHYAKSLAGLVKKRKKQVSVTKEPSLEELRSAKVIANENGGIDKLLARINELEILATPVFDVANLKMLLLHLKDLTA